jgi:hypothetical protein
MFIFFAAATTGFVLGVACEWLLARRGSKASGSTAAAFIAIEVVIFALVGESALMYLAVATFGFIASSATRSMFKQRVAT